MNAGAVKLQSKRQARQYMNRKVRHRADGHAMLLALAMHSARQVLSGCVF